MSLSIKAFDMGNRLDVTGNNAEQRASGAGKQNFFGGNLKLADDPIARRRKEAQEAAWNVVKKAWKNDQSVDEAVQVRRNHYAELETLRKEAAEMLADVNEDKQVLMELYEVDKESIEQQELDLLEKEQDLKNGVSHETLTKEEWEQLAKIKEKPLTEYQERALELNERAGNQKRQIQNLTRQMQDDVADITSICLERLKSNPMLDAKQAAEEIQKAANDEIIGMLMQEAQEYVDEKMEEAEEKADESMEKKEEREEQLEEIKLKRAVQEALIEETKEAAEKAKAIAHRNETPDIEFRELVDILKSGDLSKEVGQSLDEIKSSMKLLEADLKGIKVDEEI